MLRVRTDDEIYRVDAVWLGPPRATFPWRATYASYMTGFLIFIMVLFIQRRMGIAFNIFPTAWALVITVFLTRLINRKVNYEKGVVQLFQHFWYEVCGPRERTAHRRSSIRSNHIRVRRTPSGPVVRAPQRRSGPAPPADAARATPPADAARATQARSRPARPSQEGRARTQARRQSRRPRPRPMRPGGDR